MDIDKLMRDMIIDRLRGRFAMEYKEIKVNVEGSPDIVLANHGLTVAVAEVETEKSITPEKAKKWKEMAQSGSKLILMIPKNAKVKVMQLLWEQGIADEVGVGSYLKIVTSPPQKKCPALKT